MSKKKYNKLIVSKELQGKGNQTKAPLVDMNAKKTEVQQQESQGFNNSEIILYYGYQLEQLQYEANGIWNRFNIMIGISVSLFVLLSFLFTSQVENKHDLILIVCGGGFFVSLWSLYVLKKLWMYHYHWKARIQELEKHLPQNIVKPFSEIPATISKSKKRGIEVWYKAKTQPYFIIITLIWLSIFFSNLYLANKSATNDSLSESNSNKGKGQQHKDSLRINEHSDSLLNKTNQNGH